MVTDALKRIAGTVEIAPGQERRFLISRTRGDCFAAGADYDGVTLTLEATSMKEAEAALDALTYGRP